MSDIDLDSCNLSTCDISTSYYGYRPNLGIDVFLAIVYALNLIGCIVILVWKRTWLGYSIAMMIGTFLELVGFVLRGLGYNNPWGLTQFILQYTFLTIAPIFMCAAIYLSLGALSRTIGTGYFGIKPAIYPRVFILSDVIALSIQATGGGISSAKTTASTGHGLSTGAIITITGLAIQVASLVIFYTLFAAVVLPSGIIRSRPALAPTPASSGSDSKSHLEKAEAERRHTRLFVLAIAAAALLILARSAYRVAELSHGLYDGLATNQWLFVGLDGLLVAIATTVLVVFHPVFTLDWRGTAAPSDADAVYLGPQLLAHSMEQDERF